MIASGGGVLDACSQAAGAPGQARSDERLLLDLEDIQHLSANMPALPALPTARLFVRRDGRTLRARHLHAACASVRRAAERPARTSTTCGTRD